MIKTIKFLYVVISVLLTAYLCSYLNAIGMQNFYYDMTFPPLVPDGIVFSFVWSVLYVLLIVSFYVISIKATKEEFMRANFWFLVQLILQIIWTYTYFYLGYIGVSVIIILLLDYSVLKMIRAFKVTDIIMGYLQYPYLIWLLFATYLNFGFVYYNGMIVGKE